jgi:glyoxylase-like metal-dependent hydrolase (beta-lactamase superfamily II)
MKIGNYNIYTIETGKFALDGGSLFGVIPKIFWNKSYPADKQNKVTLHNRSLLLVNSSRKILIDTGIGSAWDEEFSKTYHLDQNQFSIFNALDALKIKPGDITDIILTHLHFDHTGGSTRLENGKWIPSFPNAIYHIQKEHFNWANNPSVFESFSFIRNRVLPLYENGVLNLIKGRLNFDDEIELLPVNGHTMCQQLVKIHDPLESLLFCGDLFPFSLHISLQHIMSYDLQPLTTINEKKILLTEAVNKRWKLFFGHDPVVVMATVAEFGSDFCIDKVFTEMI